MTKRDLIDRWLTPDGAALSMDVAAGLVGGRPIEPSRVGTHNGRLDLRGFQLPAPDRNFLSRFGGLSVYALEGVFSLQGRAWRGLDLSYSTLPSLRFTDMVIDNCVFDDATCLDWRFWNSHISSSSFARTDLRDASMGVRDGPTNSWVDVAFDHTHFGELWVWCGKFDRCLFDHPRMHATRFRGCVMTNSKFVGPLVDVLFDFRKEINPKSRASNIDFSETTFSEVEFAGFISDGIVLPTTQDLRLIPHYRRVVQRQLKALPREDAPLVRQVRAVLEHDLRAAGRRDSTGLFNRQDWLNWGGEELAAVAETSLRRALRED
jgi:uncharacterized protein YjbI with pentapeptide repeats